MVSWEGVLIGLITGIIATLLADNPHVRFNVEKFIRKIMGKPLISARLSCFPNYCKKGIFLVYCIELKNEMLLTPQIPRVYILSRGAIDYDAHAYKPLLYFRSHGMYGNRLELTTEQLLNEYESKINPFTPDNPNASLNLSRRMPYRVIVLCELIELEETREDQPLNHLQVLGELRLPMTNPMPKTRPGAWWYMNVISEDFGLIDIFHITIPKDLKDRKPLGDTIDTLTMKERPPCLLDLGYENRLTWPLRFNVDECEIVVKSGTPPEVVVKKPRKKIHGIEIRKKTKRRLTDRGQGIKLQ